MTRRTRTVPLASLLFLAALAAPASAADNVAAASPGAPPPAVTWTLEEVADIALKNHPLVKQANADVDAAVARKGQAESAWYPFIN
ncbi:MAG TPA: hypothetical protein VF853_00540, partial [Candidatus Deferrimicrobiaceae bacterium]